MTERALSQLQAAVARVACSDETHTIRWEAGNLVALDHADPEGERALAALGGQSCTCLDLLGAWTRRRGDAALLSALSRGPQDPVHNEGLRPGRFGAYPAGPVPRNVVSARRGGGVVRSRAAYGNSVSMTVFAAPPGSAGPPASASSTPEDDIVVLAGLGHELTLRLASTVTSALLEGLKTPKGASMGPILEASLFGRAWAALRTWLGTPDLELDLEVIGPDAEPGLSWDGSGPVHLALPLEWVMTVWGADLSMVAGRFSLGLAERDGARSTLISVGTDLGPPRPLILEIP
jgi:hypothetical protein